VYRSSTVKRWGIVAISKEQSVAEHTFQVTMIASRLCDMMGESEVVRGQVIEYALVHDMAEVLTGDMATPLKDFIGPEAKARLEKFEEQILVLGRSIETGDRIKWIVKIADLVEAITFLNQHSITEHGKQVAGYLREKLDRVSAEYGTKALDEIENSEMVTLDRVINNAV
jgi:5'-deoxynucleotidase YfbR-like HD superfamily hydrolase